MRKFLFLTSVMAMIAVTAMAVPAKRGTHKMLKLADGTEVKAQLVGDEHGHFWMTEDGKAYAQDGNTKTYKQVEKKTIIERAKARRAKVNAKRVQKRQFGHPTTILGQKKAIMLLVNFKDTKFNTAHDNALYQRIANEENFSEGKFKGSMADYFKAQSRGKFELDFDVVGPLTVSQNASYYGENDENDNDMHSGQMVCEAVKLAKEQVSDWTPYDWDGDGEVDQVYVVYAGEGEADGGDENTIWPHAYALDDAKFYGDGDGAVTVGTNLKVNSYACGPELQGYSGEIAGIGTMCHEYSHCLGYPDFYDIDYSGGQGMGAWDLMDAGSYNGDGYQPAGYTSYERWFAGWEEPIELKAEDVNVTNMKSLQAGGESYIIYNDKNANEYYLLENRQFDGWDASAPYNGLLIIHCDYDASVWEQNAPNDDPNHQRFTVVPADGKYTYEIYEGNKYYDDAETFPYKTVNSFNKNFKTSEKQAKNAAKFFTKTSNGTYWMNGSVEEITQNADGTISFNYVAEFNTGNNSDTTTVNIDGALFYESFNDCAGTGANDDNWGSSVASAAFNPDNDGWTAEAKYGGYQCARFGSSKKVGKATSPSISLTSNSNIVSFKAAGWGNDDTTLKLSATGATVTIEPSEFTMTSSEWTTFTAKITGSGNIKLVFTPAKRFFLDEVIVKDNTVQTGISTTPSVSAKQNRIYTLDGRFVGSDVNALKHGLYIINGKKVVK
ncbi:M6 family metalloprotease domain-containing protein [Prevotella sp. E2-28]|uniref:M6 family metalloprotease domain-containing protein n=1 Tax=Prevotella sp. E2-28 TaxID=2913620 RepID=UPI001EDAADDF|nr:M6 family metalloprotease domain-containing protein [Prevotella sp. E2-28]UKK52397.1 M6 family metalloprotease domain-containing protein [Prevotella sp. E2-28]